MVINYEQMNKSNHQNVNIVITDVKKYIARVHGLRMF